jgi:hypothetical protein
MAIMTWVSIAERLPPLDEIVPFCCWIDDRFTEVDFGKYTGEKTLGDAVVMEGELYWYPCSHWYEIPAPTAPVKAEERE